MTTKKQPYPPLALARPEPRAPQGTQRRPAIRQRDLTKAMKAAKAAGIEAFELQDAVSGLIFRALGTGAVIREDDLDTELRRFEATRGG